MAYKNKEDAKAYRHAHYIKNKAKKNAYSNAYMSRNKDRMKEVMKAYYIKNKERILKQQFDHAKRTGIGTWRWSKEYQQWKKAVYIQYNHTCNDCGKNHCKINAHHIKPAKDFPELRYDVQNGICLCVECHKRRHSSND